MPNNAEAFPFLQYSKGFGRCSRCTLVRPFEHLATVDGVCACRDAANCARMKALKEEDDFGEAEVVKQQAKRALPTPESEEQVELSTFWNSANPPLV